MVGRMLRLMPEHGVLLVDFGEAFRQKISLIFVGVLQLERHLEWLILGIW